MPGTTCLSLQFLGNTKTCSCPGPQVPSRPTTRMHHTTTYSVHDLAKAKAGTETQGQRQGCLHCLHCSSHGCLHCPSHGCPDEVWPSAPHQCADQHASFSLGRQALSPNAVPRRTQQTIEFTGGQQQASLQDKKQVMAPKPWSMLLLHRQLRQLQLVEPYHAPCHTCMQFAKTLTCKLLSRLLCPNHCQLPAPDVAQ